MASDEYPILWTTRAIFSAAACCVRPAVCVRRMAANHQKSPESGDAHRWHCKGNEWIRSKISASTLLATTLLVEATDDFSTRLCVFMIARLLCRSLELQAAARNQLWSVPFATSAHSCTINKWMVLLGESS